MSTYRTLHTQAGLRKLLNARFGGAPVGLVHMAFGDGGGNPVDVEVPQEGLVRERYRVELNRVFQDPDNPLMLYAEGILSAQVGGFTVREISLIDSDGDVFAVANTPDSYQPLPDEGAVGDGIYRVAFAVSNAGNVTVVLDPNSSVASRAWVLNTINAAHVIPGGTTGQQLTKASNADGDFVWGSAGDVNVLVNTIEERQTLADGQRTVDLTTTTSLGLAIYLDGVRIARGIGVDEWEADPDVITRIKLGASHAAGTRLIAVQNEPAGNIGNPLERSANLADVPDKGAARSNLGVYGRDETRQMAPAGMIGTFAGSNAPTGWLKANGAQVAKDAYPALYAAVGDLYTPAGQSPAAGSFFLPDLRGMFPRFWDDGRGNDAGRTIGSNQGDQLAAHAHGGRTSEAGDHAHDSSFGEGNKHTAAAPYGMSSHRPGNRNAGSSGGVDYDNYAWQTSTDGRHAHDFTTSVTGGNETRPKNVALLACIKY